MTKLLLFAWVIALTACSNGEGPKEKSPTKKRVVEQFEKIEVADSVSVDDICEFKDTIITLPSNSVTLPPDPE